MHPARKRTRPSGEAMGNCAAGRIPVAAVNTGAAECPICMNAFGAGPRTIVRPFRCVGTAKHAICRACDSTLYRRHDDRCPTCRAERDVATSDARHGGREEGTPVHLRDADPMGIADVAAAAVGTMFFPIDDGYRVVSGPSISILHPPDAEDGAAANIVAHLLNSAGLSGPLPVLEFTRVDGEPGDDAMIPEILYRAAAAIHGDPRMTAALEGLRNVASVPLGAFVARVHRPEQAVRLPVTIPEHPPSRRRRSPGSFNRRV